MTLSSQECDSDMEKFDACLQFTLREEGGYQSLEDDPGNWSSGRCGEGALIGTCHGISAPVLAAWLGSSGATGLTPAYMRALPRQIAASIFGAQYWLPCAGPQLPVGVDLMVFDHGVNCGVRPSVRLMQAAVGVTADGYVGSQTLAAVRHASAGALIEFLARLQENSYRAMPAADRFLGGWLARLKRRRAAALALLQGRPA
jgi:lysozyme family protein